ncbi:MAG: hypothetical protein R3Y64_08830 [Peptostreptococcaceae bacterium]
MNKSKDKEHSVKELKRFFRTLYYSTKKEFNQLQEDEYIRILQIDNKNYITEKYFNNFHELTEHIMQPNMLFKNNYFTLSTVKEAEQGGKKENLNKRYFIGLDFDKKELGENFGIKDIVNRFNEINLKYHAIVDSGHGYHVYSCIEPTDRHNEVEQITKIISKKVGADLKATTQTQVLRIPLTFNIKEEGKKKLVNIVQLYDIDTIKKYSIDHLKRRFITEKETLELKSNSKNINYALNGINLKPCTVNILENGSLKGQRNKDLQKIIVDLRKCNKKINEVIKIVQEWNFRNKEPLKKHELEYQTKHIFENLNYVKLDCNTCNIKDNCYSAAASDFSFNEEYPVLKMSEAIGKNLNKNNNDRKGNKKMEANSTVIYTILKLHEGLTYEQLEQELTYRKKCRFTKPTIIKALKELEQKGYIETSKNGLIKHYNLKKTRNKAELEYCVSYGATMDCIKGNITPTELQVYSYIRYLHHKEQRENPQALKGNLFCMQHTQIAKHFGMDRSNLTKIINNLVDEKIITIWHRQISKNNGYEYNIYRLVY